MNRRSLLLTVLVAVLSVPPSFGQWQSDAKARIEANRMNTLRVVVRDARGAPVEGAAVQVAMQSQAFDFGTALTHGLMRSGPEAYRQYVYDLTGNDRTFNIATYGNALKWPSWASYSEAVKDVMVQDIFALFSRGIDFRGHTLLWPGEQWLPAAVRDADDAATIRGLLQAHITDIIGHVSSSRIPMNGVVREWDVLNEPFHLSYLADKLRGQDGYPTGEEIYAEAFAWARAADPDARLYINEYNVLNGSSAERAGYKRIIQNLLDAGAPLGGIGMQAHFNGAAPAISTVKSVLDDFAQFGLPIAITEYDLTNTGGTVDDEYAARYMTDFLTMIYSHPAVETFVMWGFWDGDHWRGYAPVFTENWTLKPSGQAFIDLAFDAWWTDEVGATDADGAFAVAGHLGTYDVTVTVGEETLVQRDVVLERGAAQEVVFAVTATAVEDEAVPGGFRVQAAFPNPTADRAALAYVLPEPAEVTVDVYDLTGRRVRTQAAGRQAPGAHVLQLEAAGLPSGVYVYRLRAGARSHTGRLHVVR